LSAVEEKTAREPAVRPTQMARSSAKRYVMKPLSCLSTCVCVWGGAAVELFVHLPHSLAVGVSVYLCV
jgi:hypothetical protein